MHSFIRPVGLALTLLYLALVPAHLFLIPQPAVGRIMAVLAGASAVLLAAITWRAHRGGIPLRYGHTVIGGFGLVVFINSISHQFLLGDPLQTTNLILLLLAGGLLFLSVRWYLALVALVAVGWTATAWMSEWSGTWLHYGFSLWMAAILGGIVLTVRLRNYRRVEALQIQEDRRRDQLRQLLRASESTLHLFAENARDVIFRYRVAPQRGYEYINPAVERLSGYRPGEFYADP